MKSRFFILILFVTATLASCTDDITDMGKTIQPSGDKLIVMSDTLVLNTESFIVPYMYCRPDSFLLGTYYDEIYGTTQADILAQVQPPLGFTYPANAVPDSAVVSLYYVTWQGDDYSPMELNVYEMNKKTFTYTKSYPTNIDPSDYCDKTIPLGKKIFTPRDAVTLRSDTNSVRIKLYDDFVSRFAFNLTQTYTSNTDFLTQFKGIYLTPTFGSASIMNIEQMDLIYYFHYKYKYSGDDDSTTVNTYVTYPANSEVRQVNRILHPDTTAIKQRMSLAENQGYNFISSPANIYTRINVPLKSMAEKMNFNGKRLTINSCMLRVDIVENDRDDNVIEQNPISKLMIIKESAMNDFFKDRELPSDTLAIVSSYSYETDTLTDDVVYYYSYDLATLVAYEIYKAKKNNTELPDNMPLVLIPVVLTYDSSSNITKVQPQNLLNAVTIRSGANTGKPMKLKVTYSGF
jgi:hypothetical protein